MKLIFDTETSDLPQGPLGSPRHARIVQLGMVVINDDGKIIFQLNSLVEPEGWTIAQGAQNVHKISLSDCEQYGVKIINLLGIFSQLLRKADVVIGHNIAFDIKMIKHEFLMLNRTPPPELEEKAFCTMIATTAICKLPGRYGRYKWPKLEEAYEHFFSKKFDNAHDALADVIATYEIYAELWRRTSSEVSTTESLEGGSATS